MCGFIPGCSFLTIAFSGFIYQGNYWPHKMNWEVFLLSLLFQSAYLGLVFFLKCLIASGPRIFFMGRLLTTCLISKLLNLLALIVRNTPSASS